MLARRLWFFADEWEFLSGRGAGAHDLLRAHYGHWVALPLLVYRALWWAVGLRSYLPYAGLAIALHLGVAVLLWTIMRRAAVRPWTATAAASAFALFGAGAQDILWAFQIAFTGALLLGLVHLVLADHDGPLDGRDWLGLAAGSAALLCSGVAVTMVLVVGIATLLRRSWRVAAVHCLPLVVVYTAWWLGASRGKYASAGSLGQILRWCGTGAARTFGALGQVAGVGWLLAAALVAGGVLAVRDACRRGRRGERAAPVAMLAGAALFLVIAALDRSGFGTAGARAGRYLHVVAALLLPAIAIALDELLSRWKAVGVVALALLLVGIPGNVLDARNYARKQHIVDDATRRIMLTVPRDPLARTAPAGLRPEPNRAPTVTIEWLRAGVASGRVPSTRSPSPVDAATNRLRLSLMELDGRRERACPPLRAPLVLDLRTGERFGLGGRAVVALLERGRAVSHPVVFGVGMLNPSLRHTVVVVAGPLTIRVGPGAPVGPLGTTLCRETS